MPSEHILGSHSQASIRHESTVQAEAAHQIALDSRIAVVGIACRLPGADTPEALWDLLKARRDSISRATDDRYRTMRYTPDRIAEVRRIGLDLGGYIEAIDQFDPTLFGISFGEAAVMDPQQRVLLEVTWSALENAGIAPDRIAGTRTGVFVGIGSFDYSLQQAGLDPYGKRITPYSALGNAHSIAANRISYVFDLKGPSLAVDTACSSSLYALHYARQSLASRECDSALVAGVHLIMSMNVSRAFSKTHMLARDGHCKVFDAAADGYVRAEGCVAVVLKRLADAITDGDRVLGVIVGSAVNQDGKTEGITAPSGDMQVAAIGAALAAAGFDQSSISYVEAHGTGTKRGDTIELAALARVFRGDRTNPCHVGSVAANLGHLEPVRGLAGLLKTLLCLEHEEIPGQANLKALNEAAEAEGARIVVARETVPWPRGRRPRRAGISSFGFGGANSHVVLEEAPAAERTGRCDRERPIHVLKISARKPEQLAETARRLSAALAADPGLELADICHSANVGRADLRERTLVAARTREELVAGLEAVPAVQCARAVAPGPGRRAKKRTAFLFTGQGVQYRGMGASLFKTEPRFAETLHQADEALRGSARFSLIDLLYGGDALDAGAINQTRFAEPALLSVELALARLWISWGIEPEFLLGHGVGEYVAAVLDGVMSFEDALRLVARRGELTTSLTHGAMVAVAADENRVAAMTGGNLEIAAINGPKSTVVSGTVAAVEAFEALARGAGITCRRLEVAHAFHSPLMAPVQESLREAAARYEYRQPSPAFISGVTGRPLAEGETIDAAYWAGQIRRPVRFWCGIETMLAAGVDTMVEVGPHSALLPGIARQMRERDVTVAASLARGRDDWDALSSSLATLYKAGLAIDWKGWDAPYGRKRVVLPNYPFARDRFWYSNDAPEGAEQARIERAEGIAPIAPAARVMERAEVLDFLRRHMSEVTGVSADQLGEDTKFRETGMDSVVGLEIMLRLENALGVMPPPDQLAEDSTLGDLADVIVGALKEAGRAAIVPQEPGVSMGNGAQAKAPAAASSGSAREMQAADRARSNGAVSPPVAAMALPPIADVAPAPSPLAAPDLLASSPGDYCDAIRPDFTGAVRELALNLDCHWAEGDRVRGRINGVELEAIDMLGGYGATLFGHNHPALVAVLQGALHAKRPQFVQMTNRTAAGMLAKELVRQVGALTGDDYVAVLGSTGAEVVDAAVKHVLMEWAARRREWLDAHDGGDAPGVDLPPVMLAVEGSYHGKTLGAYAVTWNAPGREELGLKGPFEVVWLNRDDPGRVFQEFAAHRIEGRSGAGSWSRIAGVFVEPVQGEGGIFPLSKPFLAAIRQAADAADCPVVVDEIQSGLGRCGSLLASSLLGLKGDHYLFGKALGGGLTKSSALLLSAERYQPGFGFVHTSTYGEDDHTALVGLRALKLLEEDGLARRAAETGSYILDRLRALKGEYPGVLADVRGQGLMIGVEVADQSGNASPLIRGLHAQSLLGIVAAGCLLHSHGVRVGTTLSRPSTLRLEPSAYVSREDIDHVIRALGETCRIISIGDAATLTHHLARTDTALGRSRFKVRREAKRPVRTDAAAGVRHRGTAVFLGHMINADDIGQWDASLMSLDPAERERLAKRIAHPIPVMSAPIRAATGETVEFAVHSLALTSSVIERAFRSGQRDQVVALVGNAIEHFAAQGVRIVGLGGLLSVVTGNGLDIAGRYPSLVVTTGNTYTVALASEAILKATEECGLDPAATRLGVVGASGNIGSTLVRILADRFGRLKLVGRRASLAAVERTAEKAYADCWHRWTREGTRAGGLAAALAETGVLASIGRAGNGSGAAQAIGAHIRAALIERFGEDPLIAITDSVDDLTDCAVIVTASNSTQPIFGPHNVAQDVRLLCDISVPSDVDVDLLAARPDLKLIRGGVALAPGEAKFRVESAGLPEGHLLACMAETAILGLAGASDYPTTGEITPEGVRASAALGQRYGFSLGYMTFDKLFSIKQS